MVAFAGESTVALNYRLHNMGGFVNLTIKQFIEPNIVVLMAGKNRLLMQFDEFRME